MLSQRQKKLNPLVTSVNKLDVNNTANDVGEWYINEELDLAYFSVFTSDSVPSNTSTDVDDDPWSAINALTSLLVPVRLSLTIYQNVSDVQESFFEVPARYKDQKLILFGKIESKPITYEDSESETELSQFSNGIISIDFVSSKDNLADQLTKGLSGERINCASKGMV